MGEGGGWQLFPFRKDPCQNGFGVQESKQEITKVISLAKNGGMCT